MSNTSTTAAVSEHTDYLRRLAHALLRDAAAADDAVQETWLQAVRTPPREGPSQRAWLAQVMRNVVRKGWRGEARRKQREAAWSPRAEPEDPGTQLQRVEQAEILLAAIRRLDPAKREVIELRFFEDLPPRKIAAQLGVPVETVKTRLKRALAELRQSLEQDGGRQWPAALAGAFGVHPPGAVTAATLPLTGVLATVLLLLAIGAGGYLATTALSDDEAPSARMADLDALPAHETLAVPGPALATKGANPTPSAPNQPARTAAKPTARMRKVTGTVLIHDERGRPLHVATGTLHATQWRPSSGNGIELAVTNGQIAGEMGAGMDIEFEVLEFGDRVARITSPAERVPVPADGVLAVEAVAVPDSILHVLDANTGDPLSDVRLLRVVDSLASAVHPAGRASDARSVGPSPVAVRPHVDDVRRHAAKFHVGSPGYAWAETDLPFGEGADHIVELQRAGSAELLVEGPALHVPAYVRFRHKQGKHYGAIASFALRPGQAITCAGLPYGSYLARVELGYYFSRPRVLGQVAFEVVEGEVATATLRYKAFAKPPAVPLAGEVHVPPGWPRKGLLMSLGLRDARLIGQSNVYPVFTPTRGLKPVPDKPNTWSFDAGKVQAGRYRISFPRYEYATFLTLGPEGMTDLRIDVPKPRMVRVLVEGDRDGSEPFLTSIAWRRPAVQKLNSWSHQSAKRTSGTQPFEFRAPDGPILIRASGQAYRCKEQPFEVAAGTTQFTLRVKPTAHITVRFLAGDKAIPHDWDWNCDMKPVSEGAEVVSWGTCDEGLRVTVSGPGVYKLTMGQIAGYRTVPPLEIEVGEDGTGAATVRLERR